MAAKSSKVRHCRDFTSRPGDVVLNRTGDIPSFKLLETEFSYAFLDIGPLSKGHSLIIPKYHAEKLHQLPDEYMQDTLPIAKKIALALGCENYNILQEVDHVHFHIIPKPSALDTEGLVIGWPTQSFSKDDLQSPHDDLKNRL